METLLMAIMTVATCIIMIPRIYRPRVWGNVNIFDAVSTFYVMSHFAATGSYAGLIVGVAVALGLTITLRIGRAFFRSEKLSLDGDTSISAVFAGVFTQGAKWARGITAALFNGGHVRKPVPLNWKWETDLESVNSFSEGVNRLARIL